MKQYSHQNFLKKRKKKELHAISDLLKVIRWDLASEGTICLSILVSDHLP